MTLSIDYVHPARVSRGINRVINKRLVDRYADLDTLSQKLKDDKKARKEDLSEEDREKFKKLSDAEREKCVAKLKKLKAELRAEKSRPPAMMNQIYLSASLARMIRHLAQYSCAVIQMQDNAKVVQVRHFYADGYDQLATYNMFKDLPSWTKYKEDPESFLVDEEKENEYFNHVSKTYDYLIRGREDDQYAAVKVAKKAKMFVSLLVDEYIDRFSLSLKLFQCLGRKTPAKMPHFAESYILTQLLDGQVDALEETVEFESREVTSKKTGETSKKDFKVQSLNVECTEFDQLTTLVEEYKSHWAMAQKKRPEGFVSRAEYEDYAPRMSSDEKSDAQTSEDDESEAAPKKKAAASPKKKEKLPKKEKAEKPAKPAKAPKPAKAEKPAKAPKKEKPASVKRGRMIKA